VINPNEKYIERIGQDGSNFEVTGFFVDVTTHCYDANSEYESHYLCAILNSKKLDNLIKPFQAKGDFGERHINKIPLSFPIPQYDSNILSHRELAEDGIICHKKVKNIIQSLSIRSVGKIRSIIRKELASEFASIDNNVQAILSGNY
jgi:hypothetical protein